MREMNRSPQVQVANRSGEDGGVGAETFETFFEAERDGLFGALVLITGNRHEAEEIAQDALPGTLGRWDRVAGLEDPTGYLYRTP